MWCSTGVLDGCGVAMAISSDLYFKSRSNRKISLPVYYESLSKTDYKLFYVYVQFIYMSNFPPRGRGRVTWNTTRAMVYCKNEARGCILH